MGAVGEEVGEVMVGIERRGIERRQPFVGVLVWESRGEMVERRED